MFKEVPVDCETLAETLLELLAERYELVDIAEMLFLSNYSWDEIYSIGLSEEAVEAAKNYYEGIGI